MLGGGNHYATKEYLPKATPYDQLLVLENLTALALEAEKEGDMVEAMEIFRKLEPLAKRSEMLGNLLHEWKTMCYNHPELSLNAPLRLRVSVALTFRIGSYTPKGHNSWGSAFNKAMRKLMEIDDFGIELADAEAIMLAKTNAIKLLFTDDKSTREIAEYYGLDVHGSAGIIARAYSSKILSYEEVRDALSLQK